MTTVGGTTRVNPEVAVSFSGGGFSRYFAQPTYQSTAVKTFLTSLGTTFSGLYKYVNEHLRLPCPINDELPESSATGRAYPDLAAQGNGFQVVIGGRVSSVGGTSASSPVRCHTESEASTVLIEIYITDGRRSLLPVE